MMPVRFKGISEYKKKFQKTFSGSQSPSAECMIPWAGLRSDEIGIAKEPSFHSKKKVPYYRSQVSRSFVWDQTQGSEPYFEDDRAAIREFQHKVKTPDAPRMDRIPRSLSNEERPYSAPPANKAKMDGGHSQKRDSKNLQSGVHRSLQKKAGLRSADLKNMGHATEYQRQYFWKMLPEASPVLSAEQLIAKRTESPFRVTPMIHETEYTRSFRGSAHSKGLRLRTDHENETEVHEPENISPVKKSKLTEDRRKDYMGAKPSAVVSETEYTKSFKGSPPVKGLRLRKDIEINEEMNSHPESMKLPKSTKKCEHSPKEDDSPLVPEKQILKVQNPQKPFFPHRSRSRRMKSEYNDNFRSPTDYCYSKGAWRKHTHHRGEGCQLPLNHFWYNEVNELKERAYAYKRRALGTHFSRDHLNQIVSNKNAFWEVSTSNSEESVSDNIRALDLARPQDLKKHKRQTKLDDPSTGENHACIEKLSIKDNEKKVSGSVHPVRRKLAWDEVKDHSEMAEEEKKEDHAVEVENLEKEQNQDHVEDNSEAAADIDVKVKEVKAEAEPSVRSISEDSASSSSNNHEEGRLPTPRMKLFGGVRRTHHDLTTPSYGGAILVSPPKVKNLSPVGRRTEPPLGKTYSPYKYVTHESPERKSHERQFFDYKTSPVAGVKTHDPIPMSDYNPPPSQVPQRLPKSNSASQCKVAAQHLPHTFPVRLQDPACRIQGTLRNSEFQHNGDIGGPRAGLYRLPPCDCDDNDDRMSQLSARSAASSSLASLVLERAQKRKETFWNTR